MKSTKRRNARGGCKWKNTERTAEINKVRRVGRKRRKRGTRKERDDK